MRKLRRRPPANRDQTFGTIMTGTLFAPALQEMIGRLNSRLGTRLDVLPVANDYFGGDVSVAGLLTGRDFMAMRDKVRGDFAIIPRVVLKSDEPVMLDGMSLDRLQQGFEVPLAALDFPALARLLMSNDVRDLLNTLD